SDEESTGTLDGTPLEDQALQLLNDSPTLVLNNKINGEGEAILLRYRSYLDVDVDVHHIDLDNLRKGKDLSHSMLDFLLL
ncbi:hypothetical protein FRC01_009179, partial [Tulasnella sp. 417]